MSVQPFTSNLSIPGFALCRQLGLRPVSQVMGSSVYQVGYQPNEGPASSFGNAVVREMDTLASAWNTARKLALDRVSEEASKLGASGVVGIGVRSGLHDWSAATGASTIEYVAAGTAVRHDAAGRSARHGGQPLLSALPLGEHSQLLGAGFDPLGVVAWTSVLFLTWQVNPFVGGQIGLAPTRNYEQPEITECLYGAREQVMSELDRQASALNASGILGLQLGHHVAPHTVGAGARERHGLLITLSGIGTAVMDKARGAPSTPQPTVDLTS